MAKKCIWVKADGTACGEKPVRGHSLCAEHRLRQAETTVDEHRRGRVMHGWAFRDHSEAEKTKFREFLEFGDARILEGTIYELGAQEAIAEQVKKVRPR